MPDDQNIIVRTLIETTLDQLVTLGMTRDGAVMLLAFQSINRLELADEREKLEELRDEIDDYLEAEEDEPAARPVLTVVN